MAMEKFHFTSEDGVKITLPRFGQAFKAGWMRKHRHEDSSELGWKMIETAADEKNLKLVDELSLDDFNKLTDAWLSNSDTTVGESED